MKPLSDYVKIIAAHDSSSGYLVGFVVDTREQTTKEMLIGVASQIRTDEGDLACRFITDCYYTTIDNIYQLHEATGHYMYGTVRKDRGPSYSPIASSLLPNDGDFVVAFATLPMALTLCRRRDSDENCNEFKKFFWGAK